jgi:hypothetical protein
MLSELQIEFDKILDLLNSRIKVKENTKVYEKAANKKKIRKSKLKFLKIQNASLAVTKN